MHPKNSTTPPKAQEILLTSKAPFHTFDSFEKSLGLLEVRAGMPVNEALSSSSNLLMAATSILDRLLEGGMDANEIYGIRFLIDSAKAFVDSGTLSVEFGNRQGGEA
ncbi:DUF3077 domain-containing protein [Pseudomonas sp. B21-053]|uniref:DUF3077 domain-containing protein n=1 Tax=Pseudomonas sp. B21-053 TaxID=2895493 RepID=UPI00222EEEF5|nr:DUF3077 domain-containing protein [Pseudomonas sp. B21-053]UZE12760.1 DUF3077 domain-containing protein [Pseudomonas sp. B21-053]